MESFTDAENASMEEHYLVVLEHNKDTLIRNLNNELRKPLLEINYHLFFERFSSSTSAAPGQPAETSNILDFSDHKAWFSALIKFVTNTVSSFVSSDIIRNASAASDLHNADFNNCELYISNIWKLMLLTPPSANIITENTANSPLKGSINKISKAIGVTDFDLKYHLPSDVLIKLVADLEKKINTALCNKSWYSTWEILKKILLNTIEECLAGRHELSTLSEKQISSEFELRTITPISKFMSYILEVNIERTTKAIQFNYSNSRYYNNVINDRLLNLRNDPAAIEVVPDLRLVSRDDAGVEQTKIIIELKRPRLFPDQAIQRNSAAPNDNDEAVKGSTNQVFGYTLCTKSNQGLLSDLEHLVLLTFKNQFKIKKYNKIILGTAEYIIINDVHFYKQNITPTLEEKINSRILIAALICESFKRSDGGDSPARRPTRRRSTKSVDDYDPDYKPPNSFKSHLANNLMKDSILKRVRLQRSREVNLRAP